MNGYRDHMEFLVVYRRSSGELVSVEAFTDGSAALEALDSLDSGSNDSDLETVLLGSDSFESLKVTHGRYFVRAPEGLRPLVR